MEFSHVNYRWDDSYAATLDPVDRLVYRSNLLGSDQRITNTGGGNTSAKLVIQDPLSEEEAEILWVKGSGGDLRTAERANFSSLYQQQLLRLQDTYAAAPDRGPKSTAEDRMVECYSQATFNLNPRAPSIDTPLHSFIPFQHVDHMHPNAVIAIAAAKHSQQLTQEIFGDQIIYTPWLRPGFELGLEMQRICQAHPQAKGVLLGQHGIINWADEDKACYELTLTLIEQAARFIETKYEAKGGHAAAFGGEKHKALNESVRRAVLSKILPWLRGQLSTQQLSLGTFQDDQAILRFVNSNDASRLAELGTSCPDHFLRTKIKPLYVDWSPSTSNLDELRQLLDEGLQQYRADYTAYYQSCKHPDSPAMRDSNPRVILIPGLGMIAWGKNKSESRVTAEFYNCAVEVMRGAEAIDEYIALPRQEAFDIEYWSLEEAKLQRMPAEKTLARQVHVIISDEKATGSQTAIRRAADGAHVAAVNENLRTAEAITQAITNEQGQGIGVAGSGISACGPVISIAANAADRQSVREMFEQTVLAYGGIDSITLLTDIAIPDDASVNFAQSAWLEPYCQFLADCNLVAEEALEIWRAQGLSGTLEVKTFAADVTLSKGCLAYDFSAAAANLLARYLDPAIALNISVNGVKPDLANSFQHFSRIRVIEFLTKYGIPFNDNDSTESLIEQLTQFYAHHDWASLPISPEEQTEACFLLVSSSLNKLSNRWSLLKVDFAERF